MNAFVEMTEATANILHVTAAVEREFGEDHVVVTADGLEVKDCAGTQGLKFWKVNSRKVFAVPEEDLQAPVRKRSRKSRAHMDTVDPLDFEDTLEELKTEISRMHEKLDKVFSLTRDSPIAAGLRIPLQDALKCKITGYRYVKNWVQRESPALKRNSRL